MKIHWFQRTLCSILAFVMVLGYVPATAFASEEDGLCEHHTQHTEACGYSAAVEGHDCGHAHTDECYQSVTECVHTHGECGYVPAVDGQNCECQPDENGEIVHTDGCGFLEAVAEVPCGHVCSEESGCITKVLTCQHQHDSECGYVEGKEESPCMFMCEECAKEAADKEAADAVAALIQALPTVDALQEMTTEQQAEAYKQVQDAYDTYNALTEEQTVLLSDPEGIFAPLFDYFNAQTAPAVETVASGTCGENLIWVLNEEGTLTISGTGVMDDFDMSNNVAPWYDLRSQVATVVIENGVTSVGEDAFAYLHGMSQITLPDSLISIGGAALYDCRNLTEITISKNITSIGHGVFYGCDELSKISVDEENINFESVDGVLLNESLTVLICYPAEKVETEYSIPDSVTQIAASAFSFCAHLVNIDIADSVKTIGSNAFSHCSNLEGIRISENVTSIGSGAFSGCDRLININVADNNATYTSIDGILFNKDCTILMCHPCGKSNVSYTIPNGVTSLSAWAFYDCNSLTEIIIPNSMTYVGHGAFADCINLQNVTIPSSVTKIVDYGFSGCTSLTDITFRGNAPAFGGKVFSHVTATAYYPQNNPTWTEEVMQDYGGDITWKTNCLNHVFGEWITEGNTSSRICTLCGYAEHKVTTDSGDVEIEIPDQPDLEVEVDPVLPSDETYILVEEALDNNSDQGQAILKVFDINLKNTNGVHVQPNGTVKVKLPLDWSKNGNYKVYRVNENGTLTDMNAYQQGSHMVFETDHFSLYVIVEEPEDTPDIVASGSCGENLKYALTSDGTLTVTGSGAMYDYDGSSSAPWYNLRQSVVSIVLSRGVTSIGSEAFHDCSSLISVTIPNGITSIGKEAFSGCSKLSSVSIPSGVSTISAHCFYSCTKLTSVSIPEGVIQIEDGAFENCSDLTSVSLPNSVTSIGNSAFSDCCRLTEITIPSGVTTIGSGAFRACSQLTKITLPSGITTIGEDTFSSCYRLRSIVIPNGVTSIGNDAFRWCGGLKSVTIPNSVVTIGSDAFDNCSSLTTITIPENVNYIGDSAFYSSALTEIHFLGDGFQGKSNLFSSPVVAYYSAKNATWTQEIRDSFGTKVTWRDSSENYLVLNDSELTKETQVWIDGVSYPVKKDSAGAYVNIPDNAPPVLVTYSYNTSSGDRHTQYPTGMQAYRIHQTETAATVERLPELDNLLQYSGSSIRITGNKGIRMITSVNQDNRNMLTGNGLAGFKLLEYGTLLAQTSKLGDNPLVLGGANVKSNYAYKKGVADPVFKYADGLIQYTNVLVGFTDDQCAEDIAMRPYMKLLDENGEEFVIYGGIVYRSIGYIAYQNRNAFQPGSAAYEYVWSIIHNVYGNQYDSEYKK